MVNNLEFPFVPGARVRAITVITEAGPGEKPDRSKTIKEAGGFFSGYVHAEIGELGTVVGIDFPEEFIDSETGEIAKRYRIPTVRFDRTGTATIVGKDEIELVEPIELLDCERCGSYNGEKCRYGVEIAGIGHRCLEWHER